jgi:hypothetical protein
MHPLCLEKNTSKNIVYSLENSIDGLRVMPMNNVFAGYVFNWYFKMGCQSNRYQYSLVLDSWHKSKSHICHISVSPHGVYESGKLEDTKNEFDLKLVWPKVQKYLFLRSTASTLPWLKNSDQVIIKVLYCLSFYFRIEICNRLIFFQFL